MNKLSYVKATSRQRHKIQSAFAELLAEHGDVGNITVTELADRAEITRGTFYNYYNNLYEVGAELQGEIEKRLFSEYDNLATPESIERYIDEVFVFLGQQEGIYRELLSSDEPKLFLNQLENEMIRRVMIAMHSNGIEGKDIELELLILTNGTIATVRKYYRGEISQTLDEIRDYLKYKLYWIFENYKK